MIKWEEVLPDIHVTIMNLLLLVCDVRMSSKEKVPHPEWMNTRNDLFFIPSVCQAHSQLLSRVYLSSSFEGWTLTVRTKATRVQGRRWSFGENQNPEDSTETVNRNEDTSSQNGYRSGLVYRSRPHGKPQYLQRQYVWSEEWNWRHSQ